MPGARGGTAAWVREQPCKGSGAGEGVGVSWTSYESPELWGFSQALAWRRDHRAELEGRFRADSRWSRQERGVDASTEPGALGWAAKRPASWNKECQDAW